MWNYLTSFFHSCYKVLLHYLTKKSEIERITELNRHTVDMTCQFTQSLFQSKQLVSLKDTLSIWSEISEENSLNLIITKKKILKDSFIVISNIKICLKSLHFIQLVYYNIKKLSDENFLWDNRRDYDLIDQFWNYMLPNQVRSKYHQCSDWGKVGFQGNDPATDFRGMGVLGLNQLTYFASSYPTQARDILEHSNHSRRYYPFAATGINITAFVMELYRERRLSKKLFEIVENFSTVETTENPLLWRGITAVHDVYCEIWMEFDRVWEEKDPENIMAFQTIFNEVKNSFRKKYVPC